MAGTGKDMKSAKYFISEFTENINIKGYENVSIKEKQVFKDYISY